MSSQTCNGICVEGISPQSYSISCDDAAQGDRFAVATYYVADLDSSASTPSAMHKVDICSTIVLCTRSRSVIMLDICSTIGTI